ncbi:hypothetical protein F4824DRAFT_152003 [Ustulina deusta]|nr:hypothetical protein F4824DRAFT_152003 [Ustulina deusta]
MSEERDEMLKSWKCDKDESSVKQNYYSLCRCLFGNGIGLPGDHKYHYFVPEHTINEDSFNLGNMNLQYIRQRQSATELQSTSSSHQQPSFTSYSSQHMQHTIDPLLLDERPQPHDWTVPQPGPDQDSAYGSGGAGKSVPQQNTDNGVMDYIQELDWPQLPIDTFPQDTLHQRPASIIECNWELESYDGPSK